MHVSQLIERVQTIITHANDTLPKGGDVPTLLAHATAACHEIEAALAEALDAFTTADWETVAFDIEDVTNIISPPWKQRYGPKPKLPEPGSDGWALFRQEAHAWLAIRAAATRLNRPLPERVSHEIDLMEYEGTRLGFLP